MGKPTLVPITPSVLAWAIKESGYSPTTLAAKLRVPPETIQSWILDTGQPKLTEFRKLADVLKRTPATFLLPEPPQRPAPPVEFRRPPGVDRAALNPTERRYLREAHRLRDLLLWMQDELGENHSKTLPHIRTDTNPETTAARIRTTALSPLLPRSQSAWNTSAAAFRSWRRVLERLGVLVFTFPLGRDSVRGFSIWHERAPVIAVNTAWRTEARTYTLFHEFAHVLTRTASACLEAARRFARPSDAIERWCEEFSAAILLPRQEVEAFLSQDLGWSLNDRVEDLEVPSKIAYRFKVSLRAATLRLIEMRLAAWDLYAKIPPVADDKPRGGGGRGRERGEMREGQYGDRAVRLFVTALKRDLLGRADVLDALDISDADLSKLEGRSARPT